MRKSHKLMLVAATVAMPLSFMAAVAGPQLASAGTIYFPITCAVHGTVAYNPALTQAGTDSTNALQEVTTANATFTGCLSSNSIDQGTTTGSVTIVIHSAAVKSAKINKVQHYLTGQCSAFAGAGTLKAIKGIGNITVNWAGQGVGATGSTTMFAKGGAVDSNASTGEAGFDLSSAFVSGDYTIKKGQADVFLDNTTDIALCGANVAGHDNISGSNIDPAVSTATF